MNISVKGDYALLAVLDLACQTPGEAVKIASIAKRRKIPQKFLELILASLKQGGFVESRRGAEGGYLLARPAETILVGEVLRYVEGGRGGRAQNRGDASPFAEMWEQVERSVSAILDSNNFGDLARRWTDKHSKYVPNWDI